MKGITFPKVEKLPLSRLCVLTVIGCVVLANIWYVGIVVLHNIAHPLLRAMSRDEVRYPNPTEFVPERFFDPDGELNNDSVGFAFGFGRRIW